MHNDYSDITQRIDVPPAWWDENGVPRYGTFEPGRQADIYATEIALLRITCQGCNEPFAVCMSWPPIIVMGGEGRMHEPITERTINDLHYGDPPNTGCCAAGPTMNSVPRAVLKFWRKVDFQWRRVPELEVTIHCDWWED